MRPKKKLKKHQKRVFPMVPDGYNPKGARRELFPEDEINTVVEIDGYKITNEIDEDEEPILSFSQCGITDSDYKNKAGLCMICKTSFETIDDTVIHIHKKHEILGGSQNILVDSKRLSEAGYLSILNVDDLQNIVDKTERSISKIESVNKIK